MLELELLAFLLRKRRLLFSYSKYKLVVAIFNVFEVFRSSAVERNVSKPSA